MNIRRYLIQLYFAVELYLDNNSLEGKIPKGIGGLKKLDILDLSNNALTGAIPKEVGKLKTLDVLNMANNQLSGLISGDLGKLINLSEYYIGYVCCSIRLVPSNH